MYAYVYIYIHLIYHIYIYIICIHYPFNLLIFPSPFFPSFPVPSHASAIKLTWRGRPPWKTGTVRSKTWGHRELSSARFVCVFFFEEVVNSQTKSRAVFFTSLVPQRLTWLDVCFFFGYSILYGRLVNISGFKATPNFVGSFANVVTFVTFESLRSLRWVPKLVL